MVLNSLCQGRALLCTAGPGWLLGSTYLIIYPHSLPEHIHPVVCISLSTSIPAGSSLDRTCTERGSRGWGGSLLQKWTSWSWKRSSADPNLHHLEVSCIPKIPKSCFYIALLVRAPCSMYVSELFLALISDISLFVSYLPGDKFTF